MTIEVPRSPDDCLAHCRHTMGVAEYELAIGMITWLVMSEQHAATVAAIEESHRRAMTILDRHLPQNAIGADAGGSVDG